MHATFHARWAGSVSVAISILVAAGCGGRVVVEREKNGEGQGGATAGAAGGAGTAGGGPASAIEGDCGVVCDAFARLGCDVGTCRTDCTEKYLEAGACAEALLAYIACFADHVSSLTTCNMFPPQCDDAFSTYATCLAGD